MAHEHKIIAITRPLPSVPAEYDQFSADVMRRSIEQNFDEIGAEFSRIRNQYDRDVFLSSVANNFLFMGG